MAVVTGLPWGFFMRNKFGGKERLKVNFYYIMEEIVILI
jgi:hypothetical protein